MKTSQPVPLLPPERQPEWSAKAWSTSVRLPPLRSLLLWLPPCVAPDCGDAEPARQGRSRTGPAPSIRRAGARCRGGCGGRGARLPGASPFGLRRACRPVQGPALVPGVVAAALRRGRGASGFGRWQAGAGRAASRAPLVADARPVPGTLAPWLLQFQGDPSPAEGQPGPSPAGFPAGWRGIAAAACARRGAHSGSKRRRSSCRSSPRASTRAPSSARPWGCQPSAAPCQLRGATSRRASACCRTQVG